jgi:hypothetical protein
MATLASAKQENRNNLDNKGNTNSPSLEDLFAGLGIENVGKNETGSSLKIIHTSGKPPPSVSNKYVQSLTNSVRTRQLITNVGAAGQKTTIEAAKTIQANVAAGTKAAINATQKSQKSLAKLINTNTKAINKALDKINTNIIESNKQLADAIKSLDKKIQEQIIQLNKNFTTGLQAVIDNQKLSTAELNAQILKIGSEFAAALTAFDSKLAGIASKFSSDLSGLAASIVDNRKALDSALAGQQKALDDLKLKGAQNAAYQKYKVVKTVFFCPYCRGNNHASNCAVTDNGGRGLYGLGISRGFVLQDTFKRAVPVALLEAIGGLEANNYNLQSDLGVADYFRIKHKLILSEDLHELDTVIAAYQANPDAFIKKYCIDKSNNIFTDFGINRAY